MPELERTSTPVVVSTNRARGGVTGHNVRVVLLVSLTAAVAALAIVYFLYFR